MDKPPLLAALIAERAARSPGDPAVVREGLRSVSYAEFDADIERVAARLEPRVQVGDIVAIDVTDRYLNWVGVFALARLGACSFGLSGTDAHKLLDVADPRLILSDRRVEGATRWSAVTLSPDWLDAASQPPSSRPTRALSHDLPARIIFSSGTTGGRKGVMLTHATLATRLPRYVASYQVDQSTRASPFIRPATGPGFHLPNATWSVGGVVIFDEEALIDSGRPEALRPNLVFGAPRPIAELAYGLPEDFKAPAGLRIAVGGSTVAPRLARLIAAKLSPQITNRYGATETGSVALGPLPMADNQEGVIGQVANDVEVQAVTSEGALTDPGVIGAIRIRSPGMATGYFRDPQATSAQFREGWFYPGDMGSISSQGVLRIAGRSNGVLNFGGQKVLAETIETFLNTLDGVQDAGACLLLNRLGAPSLCLGVTAGPDVRDVAIAEAVMERFGLKATITRMARLPRNEMGKIQTAMLALGLATRSRGAFRVPGALPARGGRSAPSRGRR